MSSIICPHCKAKNPADYLICETCGSALPIEDSDTLAGKAHDLEEDVLEGLDDWLQELEDIPDPVDESEDTRFELAQDVRLVQGLKDSQGNVTEDDVDDLLNWLQEQEPEDESVEDEADTESDIPSLPNTRPIEAYHEIEGIPEQLASDELPDWLRTQSDTASEPLSQDYLQEEGEQEAGSRDDYRGDLDLRAPLIIGAAASASEPKGSFESDERDAPATDWYAEMADTDLESALDEMLDQANETSETSTDDEWLELVDEMPVPEQIQPSLKEDVEDATAKSPVGKVEGEIPEWLQALKPETPDIVAEDDESVETTGPLEGLKGAVPIAAAVAGREQEQKSSQYTMSKEQQQQVMLLRQLTSVGSEKGTIALKVRPAESFLSVRVILGSILLLIVIAGWILPPLESIMPWLGSPPVSEALEVAHVVINQAAGRPALVAFEYTPAMAGELDAVASVLLRDLAQHGSPAIIVSQFAVGVPVSQRVAEEVEGLEYLMLGYLPGDASGLRLLGSCLSTSVSCEEIADLTGAENAQEMLAGVGSIVVISGDRDGIVNWVEQVGTQTNLPVIAGVTQGIRPMANPYVKSNQIAGIVEGMPAAIAYEGEYLDGQGFASKSLTSITLVQWLAILAIVIGSLYYGLSRSVLSSGNEIGI